MGEALIPGTDTRTFLTVIGSLGGKNSCRHVGCSPVVPDM
jgi:hypothetical protein